MKAVDRGHSVELIGYDKLRWVLTKSPEVRERVKDIHQKIGQDVVDDAKRRARGQRTATSKLATSPSALKSARRARGAVVVLNASNKTNAWAFGAEFGAKRYRRFQPWTGNQHVVLRDGPGYALYPAIRAAVPEIEQQILDMIEDIWT